MSQPAAAIREREPAGLPTVLHEPWPGLSIGLVALGLLFHREIAAAVDTWIDSSAYNHCFLVIPIVLFLIWDRRAALHGATAAPAPFAALLLLPLAVAWLAAERLGVMEGRQLVAMSMAEVLLLALLGPRLWRALLGPLLYLYFLVPFGGFLTPGLQDVTTWFTRHGLEVLGVPAYVDGHSIEIPEGTFFVAEACAGLRFLIASLAFGVLYALLMYRSKLRRILFISAAIVVPIAANGLRALGIVVLGHVLGSAQAVEADHVLYGWIFFSLVILLLIVLGLPFRQDEQKPASLLMPGQTGSTHSGWLAVLAVVAMAALGPVAVLGLDRASAMPAGGLQPLDLAPSCIDQGSKVLPAGGLAGRAIAQQVNCDGLVLSVALELFPSRATAAPVNADRRRLTRAPDGEDVSETAVLTQDGARLPGWGLVRAAGSGYVAVAGLWIDGRPAEPGLAMRLRMAAASVLGAAYVPALVVATPVVDWSNVGVVARRRLQRQIAAWLQAHPGIGDQVRMSAHIER